MKCSEIPETRYGEFSKRIHSRVSARRIPLDGTIELTFRCNLKCAHCYCSLPANDKRILDSELTTGEWFRVIDEIAEQECFWLLLTGGEPLIRKDFKDIYTYAKTKGMLITLFTNGTLITPEIADFLAEYPPFLVEITVYGATPKTYEKITQTPGSFSRCINGINLLLERKIPLQLKTMAMKANYAEFNAIKAFCENLGMKFRFDPHIEPRRDGSLSPCGERLSPEEVVELDIADEQRVQKFREGYYEEAKRSSGRSQTQDNLYGCDAGVDMFSINPYGQMQICQSVPAPSCDLREVSFAHGWKDIFPRIKSISRKKESPCRGCEKRMLCAYCPAWAERESGNPEDAIEYLCRIASLRQEAFGLK